MSPSKYHNIYFQCLFNSTVLRWAT